MISSIYNRRSRSCQNLSVLLLAISFFSNSSTCRAQVGATAQAPATAPTQETFKNPLLNSGPDPWIIQQGDTYYYMNTTGSNLTIWKTHDPVDLRHAEKRVVWTPPATGPYSHEIWAPELHFLKGKWYIYFGADAGRNEDHRIWVLENPSADPLHGEWTMKGKLADVSDKWAIDPSVFEQDGRTYLIWSGWPGNENGMQNIYIAAMKDPWTLAGQRVLLSTPDYPWERVGDATWTLQPGDPPHIDVNEGPEILRHGNKLFLVYSAAACWTDHYALGMLTAETGSDLLKPASWKKSPRPVFESSAQSHAFGTGHNSFFQSSQGHEDWIIYHANPKPHQGCGDQRSPRAQRFQWKPDGTPDFGTPVSIDSRIPAPSR